MLGPTKTFALDFDSVLADTMVIWVKEYNERHHTSITKNDIYAWDISKFFRLLLRRFRSYLIMYGNIDGKKFHHASPIKIVP